MCIGFPLSVMIYTNKHVYHAKSIFVSWNFCIQCTLYTSYYTFSFLHNSFFIYFMYIITKFSFMNFFKRFVPIILEICLTTSNFYSKLMSQKWLKTRFYSIYDYELFGKMIRSIRTHDAMLEKHVYSPSTRINVKSLTNNVTRRYMEK